MPFDASVFPLTIRIARSADAAAEEVANRDARLVTSPVGRALLVGAAAFAVFCGFMWMHTYSRSAVPAAIGGGLGYMLGVLLYTMLWAVGGRVATGSSRFARHFVWACVVTVTLILLGVAQNALLFFLPSPFLYVPLAVVSITAVATTIFGHLGIASSMPPVRRWRVAGIAVASIAALVGLAVYSGWNDFSTRVDYVGAIEPLSATVIPAESPDDFAHGLDAVKRKLDRKGSREH